MKEDMIKKIVHEAEKSVRRAIAPYSEFQAGAALVTEKGKIYTGCTIENSSLMLSVCAENVALTKALSEGEKKFQAMAIACGTKEYCFPCGSCRQLLWEFAGNIDLILCGRKGIKKYALSELLPHAFSK